MQGLPHASDEGSWALELVHLLEPVLPFARLKVMDGDTKTMLFLLDITQFLEVSHLVKISRQRGPVGQYFFRSQVVICLGSF